MMVGSLLVFLSGLYLMDTFAQKQKFGVYSMRLHSDVIRLNKKPNAGSLWVRRELFKTQLLKTFASFHEECHIVQVSSRLGYCSA